MSWSRDYYGCYSKKGNARPKMCFSKNVRGDKLEGVVWETTSRLLSQPELIVEHVKNRPQTHATAYLEADLDKVCHALEKKVVEADRMLDAYKVGVMDFHTLRQKIEAIKKEETQLTEEKARLEGEVRKAEAQELNEEKLREFCQNLPATLTNLDFQDRRQILREVVDRIVVDGDEVTTYGIIPVPEERVEDVSIELQSS